MSGHQGKTYLLTGASRGIGAQCARRLMSEGARVIGVARDAEALEALCVEAERLKGELIPRPLDLTARDGLVTWAEALWAELGPLDGVIHNAGVDDFQATEQMASEDLIRQVDLNLTAPLLINRALLPHLLAQGRGVLVHMSSVAGYLPVPFGGVYSATKSALFSYNEALSIEYHDRPLSFVSVHPGFVHGTGMHERHKARAGRAPLALGGTSDEAVVETIMSALLSDKSGPRIVNKAPTRPLILLFHALPRLARWIMVRLVRPYLAKVAGVSAK